MADDYDDGSIDLKKVVKSSVRELVAEDAAAMQQRAAEATNQRINKLLLESLEEAGLDQKEWEAVLQRDPDTAWGAMKKGMRKYVSKTLAKSKVKPKATTARTKALASETEAKEPRRSPYAPPQRNVEKAREVAKTDRKGDMVAVFEALFENDPFFK